MLQGEGGHQIGRVEREPGVGYNKKVVLDW